MASNKSITWGVICDYKKRYKWLGTNRKLFFGDFSLTNTFSLKNVYTHLKFSLSNSIGTRKPNTSDLLDELLALSGSNRLSWKHKIGPEKCLSGSWLKTYVDGIWEMTLVLSSDLHTKPIYTHMHTYTQEHMYTQTHVDKKIRKQWAREKKEIKLESEYETNVYLTI